MRKPVSLIVLFLCIIFLSNAQDNPPVKYQSLLWEITGNGLTKPSYLFGTMHVSSKMAFHLSDSFYLAIAGCDAVSLEVNPKEWQPAMFRVEEAQAVMQRYKSRLLTEYMNENSFRLNTNYDDNLKRALIEEPYQISGLLYRTAQYQADFQENTYLDLYIYQTGRKLGKKALGVENYMESEKLMLEATEDMMKEKRKVKLNTSGENPYTLQQKLQDAYRKGDLDLMDSLNKMMTVSEAFNEKFLYKRNEIQANSIDSIIKHESLFVGVGAAHLPGERGVIELLRKKGYTLRPIKMEERDAERKEKIDKMRVPVVMKQVSTPDGFIQLSLPGDLYKRANTFGYDGWQYADMENGTYYMVTRINTNAGMVGQNEDAVLKNIDSLLYDNVPGKILKKEAITRSGYKGFDILNKTRRGDIQRYNLLVTPFEILMIKMSGTEDYVTGKEADEFFGSIKLKEQDNKAVNFMPLSGGFKASFPQTPNVSFSRSTEDRLPGWEYEAVDKSTGDAYIVWQKSINNYRFLEEDTFSLSLMEQSLKGSDIISKQLSRKFDKLNGYACLDMLFSLKKGGILKARAVIKGADYYLAAVESKNEKSDFKKFFDDFKLTGFNYSGTDWYTDSANKFSVRTPVRPIIPEDLRSYVEKSQSANFLLRPQDSYTSITQTESACFKSDSTGESVLVTIQTLPKYFYRKDTLKFWDNEMRWSKLAEDFIIKQKEYFKTNDTVFGCKYTLLDTNTNQKIKGLLEVKGNTLYKITALTDNLGQESDFIKDFFASFRVDLKSNGYTMFESKTPLFFKDYASKDSLTRKIAHNAINSVQFEGKDLDKIMQHINKLKPESKTYLETKEKWIHAVGRMDDTCCVEKSVAILKNIAANAGDTSALENVAVLGLARTKSQASYNELKDILTNKTPVFDNSSEYRVLFSYIDDSLSLAKSLYPELLQLETIEDYKYPVNSLLYKLVDSGYLKGDDYAGYFSKIYFDARIQLKKQKGRDDATNRNDDENEEATEPVRYVQQMNTSSISNNNLSVYGVLLMPFYDQKTEVPKFFETVLQSKDMNAKMSAVTLLLKNDKPVPDTVLESFASNDKYRAVLWEQLEKIKKQNLFPAKYKTQEDLAKSLLLNNKNFEKFADAQLIGKQYVDLKSEKGYVYFFKYKLQKSGDWLLGISGVQPKEQASVNANKYLVTMTDRKFKTDKSELEQCQEKLNQMILAKHKSAAFFFQERNNNTITGLMLR